MNYYNDSKQALSDLISDLENDNGILLIAKEDVESELDYANNCHNLEEQLGCPLKIVVRALKEGIYYKFIETDYLLNKMKVPMLRIIDDEYCLICPKWASTTWMNVKLEDYKKTWWLKRDKSE